MQAPTPSAHPLIEQARQRLAALAAALAAATRLERMSANEAVGTLIVPPQPVEPGSKPAFVEEDERGWNSF